MYSAFYEPWCSASWASRSTFALSSSVLVANSFRAKTRAFTTVLSRNIPSREHSACKVRLAAYRAPQSCGLIPLASLKANVSAGVSVSTGGSCSDRRKGTVSIKTTDSATDDALVLDKVSSVSGCDHEKPVDAEDAKESGAEVRSASGLASGAMRKRGLREIGSSSAASVVG